MKKPVLLSILFAVALTGCGTNSLSSGSNPGTPTASVPATQTQGSNSNSSNSIAPTQQGATQNASPASNQTQNTPASPAQPSTNQTPSPTQPVTKDHPAADSGQVIGNPPPSESVTADEVVAQFYSDLGGKQYKSAWTWLYTADQLSQPYDKFSSQKLSATLVSVSKPSYLETYTFHSFNKTLTHVAVVTAKLSDGTTKTIHAAMDDQGWKLAWNPNDGLE